MRTKNLGPLDGDGHGKNALFDSTIDIINCQWQDQMNLIHRVQHKLRWRRRSASKWQSKLKHQLSEYSAWNWINKPYGCTIIEQGKRVSWLCSFSSSSTYLLYFTEYWRVIGTDIYFSAMNLAMCLKAVHKDIVTIWNIRARGLHDVCTGLYFNFCIHHFLVVLPRWRIPPSNDGHRGGPPGFDQHYVGGPGMLAGNTADDRYQAE